MIGSDGSITLRVHTPSNPDGGDYVFTAEVTSESADSDLSNNTATTTLHVIRQHIVSNTNDSGPGSLRKAIEGANGWCTQMRPCEIKFRFREGFQPGHRAAVSAPTADRVRSAHGKQARQLR